MRYKERLYQIVFATDTPAGKKFDVALLWIILSSVLTVSLESIPEIGIPYHREFIIVEWFFTIVFTIEYFLRIIVSPKPLRYVFSFWGLIDLMSIVPTYLSVIFPPSHYLLTIRVFRLLRIFRIFKLARFNKEAQVLLQALKESLHRISLFFTAVLAIVIVMGTLMYVVEGGKEGFTSIPQSIYWAIVTITTVGYGYIVPQSGLGKLISSISMIIGYAIIAVPTGIVTVALARSSDMKKPCEACGYKNTAEANYCTYCGNSVGDKT